MVSLNDHRKAILKLKGDELSDCPAFLAAVSAVTKGHETFGAHDMLSLLLVIFKHLRAAVQSGSQASRDFVGRLIHDSVGPALLPTRPLADVLVYSVESSDKISLLRASDVLGAACRLATDLRDQSQSEAAGFLTPLFRHIASGPLTTKGSLIIVNQIIDSVPVDAVNEKQLLDKIVSQLATADYASIRSSIFVSHWQKHLDGGVRSAHDVERDMLSGILHDLVNGDKSAQSIVMARNLSKYLLPAIFKVFPTSCRTLLDMLQVDTAVAEDNDGDAGDEARFQSWIRVASLGSSLGAIALGDLQQSQVLDAIGHADAEIRRQAFELLASQQDTNVFLAASTFDLFKLVLDYNSVLPASNTRTEWASAAHLFFSRLLAAQITARRYARRATSTDAEKTTALDQLARLDAFLVWIFADIIDPALVSASRPPSYRIIVALITLQSYLTIFATDTDRMTQAFTGERVQLLIGCQACEFAEVRARSHTILKLAPESLPGYVSLSSPSTQILLESAWAGFANPRKTQNDAAVAALQIVFERVVLVGHGDGRLEGAIAFVDDVANRLERELESAEEGLRGGLEHLTLHGPVAGCRALAACIDLADVQAHDAWRPLFHRLSSFVHRIWRLTRTVMSLSSSTADQAQANDGPAHEIAKAYQVLSTGQEEDGDDDLDPRRLISGCWRATKEAGELLATLIDRPLGQAKEIQNIWSRVEVDAAGRTFLQWLHEIRHRGTFSAISAAFAELVETVKKVKSLSDLPASWLDLEISAITDDTLSTTRRSAALPYLLLSIVAGDESLFSSAVIRLLDLARIDNASSSDIAKVHAFNILKIILLDARQSKFMSKHFEDTVMTAVEAFPSPNWNVRNVALLLFSTLVNRSLQSARTSQHMYSSRAALEGRQTFAAWHAKYPRILPYIASYLRKCSAGEVEGAHTALFPMLIILRSLKWGEHALDLQDELRKALEPYLGSAEWQVRQVAAQSLSSLYSPEEAIGVFANLDFTSPSLDRRQGTACFAHNLMVNTIPPLSGENLIDVDAAMSAMVDFVGNLQESGQTKHAVGPIETEIWATYTAFQRLVSSGEPSAKLSRVAFDLLERSKSYGDATIPMPLVGADERDRERVRAVLLTRHDNAEVKAISLLNHPSDAVISQVFQLANDHCSLVRQSSAALKAIIDVALDEKRDYELRIEGMVWLCSIRGQIRDQVLSLIGGSEGAEPVYRRFQRMMGSRNTLVREQAMEATAWALAGSGRNEATESQRSMEDAGASLSTRIAHCAQEDKSQPSRAASAAALSQISASLFPRSSASPSDPPSVDARSLFQCQQAILALLQDDDEDIRLEVAGFVRTHLGAKRPVCQTVALEMWWQWCASYIAGLDQAERQPWTDWLVSLAKDDLGYEEDQLALKPSSGSAGTVELFEQEKPNLFRDPLVDARHAADVLLLGSRHARSTYVEQEPGDGLASPIEAAYAAQRLRLERHTLRSIAAEVEAQS